MILGKKNIKEMIELLMKLTSQIYRYKFILIELVLFILKSRIFLCHIENKTL